MNPLILLLFSLRYIALASTSIRSEVVELLSDSEHETPSGNASGLDLAFPVGVFSRTSGGEVEGLTGLNDSLNSHKKRRIEGDDSIRLITIDTDDEGIEGGQEKRTKTVSSRPVPMVNRMSVRALAQSMSLMSVDEFRGHMVVLGEEAKVPVKDTCGWNLLHEAVHTDNYEVAQVLMTEFGFDPNAFDPYFGSAVYLVNSKRMAELLKSQRANLNDQRPCTLYDSAVASAIARGKLALVSIVDNLSNRSAQMQKALVDTQSTQTATKFHAHRDNMFETALSTVSRRRSTCCAALDVDFLGEFGVDRNGLSFEFINVIKGILITGRILKNKETGETTVDKPVLINEPETSYYQVMSDAALALENPAKRADYLNQIKLLGYIVGLSIYHKVPLNIQFSPIMYQIMCGLSPNRDIDMMQVLMETDSICYNSFRKMSDIPDDDINFYNFPEFKGDERRLWNPNRGPLKCKEDLLSYTPLAAKERVYTAYENALTYFSAGLESAIDTKVISKYITPEELKNLLVGETDFTAAEWRAACKAPNHDAKFNEQYEWFWRAVDDMTPEQRAKLLKYVTALVTLPIGGFKALKVQPSVQFIDEANKLDRLPRASTCFNQIRLYPVSTYETMKRNLIIVSEFGNSGFGDA